jgi:hypothetical protein
LRPPSTAHIKIGSHRASDAYRAIVASVREYLEVKEQLEIALKIAEDEGHQLSRGDEAARDSWVAPDKPEEAVAQARFEYEQAGRNDIERMEFEGYQFEVRADGTYAVRFMEGHCSRAAAFLRQRVGCRGSVDHAGAD